MGLLNSVNPELAAVESLIQKHGGVQGLVRQFEKQGLGSVAKSWVGRGENHPISPISSIGRWVTTRCRNLARSSERHRAKWLQSYRSFFRKRSTG